MIDIVTQNCDEMRWMLPFTNNVLIAPGIHSVREISTILLVILNEDTYFRSDYDYYCSVKIGTLQYLCNQDHDAMKQKQIDRSQAKATCLECSL